MNSPRILLEGKTNVETKTSSNFKMYFGTGWKIETFRLMLTRKLKYFLIIMNLIYIVGKKRVSKNGRDFCSLRIKVHKIVSYFFHRRYSSRVASTTDVVDSVITCDKLKINSYNYFLS